MNTNSVRQNKWINEKSNGNLNESKNIFLSILSLFFKWINIYEFQTIDKYKRLVDKQNQT